MDVALTFPVSVEPFPMGRASGDTATENTSKQALSSSVGLSARRRLGKLSSFEKGEASTESVFSGLYLAATVSLLRYQTSRPALRTQIPESGPCVSLYFPSLADTFLGHSGTSHEEAGCGSVSECAILWSPS